MAIFSYCYDGKVYYDGSKIKFRLSGRFHIFVAFFKNLNKFRYSEKALKNCHFRLDFFCQHKKIPFWSKTGALSLMSLISMIT